MDTPETQPPLDQIPGRSQEFLVKLARDIITNLVFTSYHLPPRDRGGFMLGMVFMPIVLGALKDMTEAAIKDIGMVYEYYDKLNCSRAINGYPIFYSCHLLNCKDTAFVWQKVQEFETLMGIVTEQACTPNAEPPSNPSPTEISPEGSPSSEPT